MSKKVLFKPNLKGFNELMKRPELQAIMQAKGEEVAERATASAINPKASYHAETKLINWIAVTNIKCDDYEAIQENLENNTLLKALYSVRDGGG